MFDKAATFYPPPEEEEEKFPPGGGGNDTVSKVIGYGMRGVLTLGLTVFGTPCSWDKALRRMVNDVLDTSCHFNSQSGVF